MEVSALALSMHAEEVEDLTRGLLDSEEFLQGEVWVERRPDGFGVFLGGGQDHQTRVVYDLLPQKIMVMERDQNGDWVENSQKTVHLSDEVLSDGIADTLVQKWRWENL